RSPGAGTGLARGGPRRHAELSQRECCRTNPEAARLHALGLAFSGPFRRFSGSETESGRSTARQRRGHLYGKVTARESRAPSPRSVRIPKKSSSRRCRTRAGNSLEKSHRRIRSRAFPPEVPSYPEL